MVAILIEYDGTEFAGWQHQLNARTVQDAIEQAVCGVFGKQCAVVGSGRTDAGVHASGQVAHIDLPPDVHHIPEDKIAIAINTQLPRDVRILDARYIHSPFHARYDAIRREYCYTIQSKRSVFSQRYVWSPELPYNPDLLVETASVFVGEHDFTTFSKYNASTKSYVCRVQECCTVINNDVTTIRIAADRFVYGMCRSIVGAMMSVARKKRTMESIAQALVRKDRSYQEVVAPPQGLVLTNVSYRNNPFT